jgi:hypothetical protein
MNFKQDLLFFNEYDNYDEIMMRNRIKKLTNQPKQRKKNSSCTIL